MNMSTLLPSIRRAGFTMIELLVVIAVIGVLAVAVLSSINPIEQINKGRDTRTRSDAAQLINATDRFFASQELYPWNDPNFACGQGNTCLQVPNNDPAAIFPTAFETAGVCTAVTAGSTGAGLCRIDVAGGAWTDGLLVTAEVKAGFLERVQAQTAYAIYTYKALGTDQPMIACFRPSSNSFQQEAVKNCQSSVIAGAYPPAIQTSICPGTGTIGDSTYVQSDTKDELICLP